MQSAQFSDFVGYFRKLASEHTAIKSFVHGASERIISQTRSELSYPCLWLETPSLKIAASDADIQGWRTSAFVVFTNSPADDYDEQDALWQQTEQIVLDILARIKRESRSLQFKIDLNSVQIDPIHTLFVDNDYGWRVEFQTDKSLDFCHNPAVWNS